MKLQTTLSCPFCCFKRKQKLLLLIFMSVLINTINIANAKEFIWISGSNETDQVGIFGEKGIPNPDNVPGARSSALAWIDSSNNLYLFGGDFEGGFRNDLWKYDGTNWTWISGSNITNQNGIYGDKGIPNADNVPGARSRAFSWTGSSDNFYLFGGFGYPEEDSFTGIFLFNDFYCVRILK